MIIISNKWIPVKGFSAMTIWPFMFLREDVLISEKLIRHEKIHGRQQREVMLLSFIIITIAVLLGCSAWWYVAVPLVFYAWYGIEWSIRKLAGDSFAYEHICFECEAYEKEDALLYLEDRPFFEHVNYIKPKR